MRVLIAPDSFKGSLRAKEVAQALEEGILSIKPEIRIKQLPLADGGEGTLEAILHSNPSDYEVVKGIFCNPLGNLIPSFYLLHTKSQTAIIEMAQTSGLELIPSHLRNPLIASTKGVGQQITHAKEMGVKKIILFVGGSATNDAGLGMASELGWVFKDQYGQNVPPFAGNLIDIKEIVSPQNPPMANIDVQIATDVNNPFCGENGATMVFGKQKGATNEQLELLEDGMMHLGQMIKNQFGIDLQSLPGTGAAGGLGGGGVFFLDGKIVAGTQILFDLINFEKHIQEADLIISGEGKLDSQTLNGKLVSAVVTLSKKHQKDLVLVIGKNEIAQAELNQMDLLKVIELSEGVGTQFAIENAISLLIQKGKEIAKFM